MKTPRDALVEKHAPIQPKLDALRQRFIASLPSLSSEPSQSTRAVSVQSNGLAWRDFVLGLRWHLAGLSGAWVVVALLWVSAGTPDTARAIQAKSVSSQTVILALKANRRQVLEFGDATTPSSPAVTPPRPSTRRSSLESKWTYC